MQPYLFLSHSGVDTEAAASLKQRIEAAPASQSIGLKVWFDKDDLLPGSRWQAEIESAIERSTAFAVLLGSRGVVNWVDAEVRLALNRATTVPGYLFIPIFASGATGPEALPGFARQYQGLGNVDSDPAQFEKLLRAVLGVSQSATRLNLEGTPFFGLRAIDETRSHLFFGRAQETSALVKLVHDVPLVMVHGDSGSGKSSLVRAGLVPRFRGAAFAELENERPQDQVWHVVTSRPRRDPWRGLAEAAEDAAKRLGLPLTDQDEVARLVTRQDDLASVRRGLRCGLSAENTRVLLVVDQFEELLTITPKDARAGFVDLLLALADPHDPRFRVVLTLRQDYLNLCVQFESLSQRLDENSRRARFRVGRMSNDGLREIVTEPLRLAGVEKLEAETLAQVVLGDVGDRPGDLALVQMALTETWEHRADHGGDLVNAYVAVGRVEGALAKAADEIRSNTLEERGRTQLDSILVRLVRLGDTGGATRRIAARDEFDEEKWALLERLATEAGKRLVLLGGSEQQPTAEIAHEAMVTAWPHFQALLQDVAVDKRVLDQLMPRGRAWALETSGVERDRHTATGAELEGYALLVKTRPDWLSAAERGFVARSESVFVDRRRRDTWQQRAVAGFAVVMTVLAVLTWSANEKAKGLVLRSGLRWMS
jgi:TIR domain